MSNGSHQGKERVRAKGENILALAERHCEIDKRGFGKIMEIFAPDYPSDLPMSKNGYGAFKYSSPLARKYIIRKFYANGNVKLVMGGRHIETHGKDLSEPLNTYGESSNALIAWQIYGYAPHDDSVKSSIPCNVVETLKGNPCVFSGHFQDVEIDHKHGREDQNGYPSGSELKNPDHYQPSTKEVNNVKRERCVKQCKRDNLRFDARELGYPVGWVQGGERFEPTRGGCLGCYYFDPVAFRQALYFRKR